MTYITNSQRVLVKQGEKQGVEKGVKQGVKEGMKQGVKQGRQNEKIKIAKNLLIKGLKPAFVREATGISAAMLKELQLKYKISLKKHN